MVVTEQPGKDVAPWGGVGPVVAGVETLGHGGGPVPYGLLDDFVDTKVGLLIEDLEERSADTSTWSYASPRAAIASPHATSSATTYDTPGSNTSP
jgi:hypothetical protein